VQGWSTPSLSAYFQGLNYIPPRTATRPVPETPTANSTGQPVSSGPNISAIAGGTVGGVLALVILIAVVLLCLRRRHRKQANQPQTEVRTNKKFELDSLNMTQKHTANYSVSDGGTALSSMTPTPAYSAQASPPTGTNSWDGEQRYYPGSLPLQGDYPHPQPYYPPPAEPSTTARQMDLHEISAELPDVRSPVNAELSDVRSPVSGGVSDTRYPVPVQELK
jgi:hypothetical protein